MARDSQSSQKAFMEHDGNIDDDVLDHDPTAQIEAMQNLRAERKWKLAKNVLGGVGRLGKVDADKASGNHDKLSDVEMATGGAVSSASAATSGLDDSEKAKLEKSKTAGTNAKAEKAEVPRLIVSGAGVASFNGRYVAEGEKVGKVKYRHESGSKQTINFTVSNAKGFWCMSEDFKGNFYFAKGEDQIPLGGWKPGPQGKRPVPTVRIEGQELEAGTVVGSQSTLLPSDQSGNAGTNRMLLFLAIGILCGGIAVTIVVKLKPDKLTMVLICGVLWIIAGVLLWLRKHKHSHRTLVAKASDNSPLDDSLELRQDQVQLGERLGKGRYGQVFKATVADRPEWKEVAVKTLPETIKPAEVKRITEDILEEIQIMRLMDHKGKHENVVQLRGFVLGDNPYLVLELAEQGELHGYLQKNCKGGSIDKALATSFCLDIAKGMEFLDSCDMVHRDLAARNVLLGKDFVCKVTDFGLAREIHANMFSMGKYVANTRQGRPSNQTAFKWTALEGLLDDTYTIQSDVWSFGIVITEICSGGEKPYKEFGLFDEKFIDYLESGKRMKPNANWDKDLFDVALSCWKEKPTARPSFSKLVVQLSQLKAKTKPASQS